jgi:probable HAF family extracellular repeat protein
LKSLSALGAFLLATVLLVPAAGADVPASYTIEDLGPANATYATPFGLNETPAAVGKLQVSYGPYQPVVWSGGGFTTLPFLGSGSDATPRAINESGVVVGGADDGTGGSYAVRWENGSVTNLGVLAGNYSEAFAINDAGVAAGVSQSTSGGGFLHAVTWDGGGITDLGVPLGGDASHARGIDTSGQVVGDSDIANSGYYHAVIWDSSSNATDLGTLPGDEISDGWAINDAGHAIGRSIDDSNGQQHAFFWDGTSMTQIPFLQGGTFLEPWAINNNDQVVGRTNVLDGDQTAFLYDQPTDQIVDLQTLLPSGSGWNLVTAFAINDAGQVVGYGIKDNLLRGFLLTPSTDPPPTDVVAQDASAGSTVSTDSGAPGTTASDPLATTITTPNAGVVSIREGIPPSSSLPSTYQLVGQTAGLSGPSASVADPLQVTFELDGSVFSGGLDPSTVEVFRNGVLVPDCTAFDPLDPNPCLSSRSLTVGGGVRVTVFTSDLSEWSFGSLLFPFQGFFSPVDNPPVLNLAKPGTAIPVRFSLGGDQGLAIFASGSPSVSSITCPSNASTDAIEQVVKASASSLAYNAGTDTYTYTWKTLKTYRGCRTLTLSLRDGTTHTATFRFGK